MKALLYPNCNTDQFSNPYIEDFISSFESQGGRVVNPKSKNPLLNILWHNYKVDICFLHWVENVPLYKYGFIQFIMVFLLFFRLKICKCKIVWFLHNKHVHGSTCFWKKRMSDFLMKFLVRFSDIVVTHSLEGIEYANLAFGRNKNIYFFSHPTKNRLSKPNSNVKKNDFLIWGSINEYKQVREFLEFVKKNKCPYKIKIVGKCNQNYYSDLLLLQTPNIEIENRGVSFTELQTFINDAKYVLIPYAPSSVLSSGTLMDSLSYGAKVIGPIVGAFAELEKNMDICVYTFNEFSDIEFILRQDDKVINVIRYGGFLESNSWKMFMVKLVDILCV